jgi:predicted transcriptional regulator
MSSKDKPYCELGRILDDLSRDRDVRGPYNIAHQVQNATGFEVSGQVVSQYLYGRFSPKREFITAFAEAFELTPQERGKLAWVYAYDSRPEHERLAIVELKRSTDLSLER